MILLLINKPNKHIPRFWRTKKRSRNVPMTLNSVNVKQNTVYSIIESPIAVTSKCKENYVISGVYVAVKMWIVLFGS
jgi:hypothetical protein